MYCRETKELCHAGMGVAVRGTDGKSGDSYTLKHINLPSGSVLTRDTMACMVRTKKGVAKLQAIIQQVRLGMIMNTLCVVAP